VGGGITGVVFGLGSGTGARMPGSTPAGGRMIGGMARPGGGAGFGRGAGPMRSGMVGPGLGGCAGDCASAGPTPVIAQASRAAIHRRCGIIPRSSGVDGANARRPARLFRSASAAYRRGGSIG